MVDIEVGWSTTYGSLLNASTRTDGSGSTANDLKADYSFSAAVTATVTVLVGTDQKSIDVQFIRGSDAGGGIRAIPAGYALSPGPGSVVESPVIIQTAGEGWIDAVPGDYSAGNFSFCRKYILTQGTTVVESQLNVIESPTFVAGTNGGTLPLILFHTGPAFYNWPSITLGSGVWTFESLFYVRKNDPVVLYSDRQSYTFTVG